MPSIWACRKGFALTGLRGDSIKSGFLPLAGRLVGLACVCLVSLALSRGLAGEADFKILNGFNDEAECAKFNIGVKVELVEEHVTEGKKAAKMTFPAGKEYAGFSVGFGEAGTGRELKTAASPRGYRFLI